MPMGEYKDFADCVARNRDKRSPESYCGEIKHRIEDKALLREAVTLEKQVKVYQGKGFSGIHIAPKRMGAAEPSTRRKSGRISKGTFWCQECGRKIPEGRHTCPKCGSEDIDIAPVKKAVGSEETTMKKAEKVRPDSKPTTSYEEPYAQSFDVDKTLRMLQKALENQIRRQAGPTAVAPSTQQVAGELKRLEKQVRKLPGCC